MLPHLFRMYVLLLFSVSEWLSLKLQPRQLEAVEKSCGTECQRSKDVNCIQGCVAKKAMKANIPYNLNRNAASSHPSPPLISFFLFQLTYQGRRKLQTYVPSHFSAFGWLNLKLKPRQLEAFRASCTTQECWRLKPGQSKTNCIEICVAKKAKKAKIPYELQRNIASSHPSPSSISFSRFQLT